MPHTPQSDSHIKFLPCFSRHHIPFFSRDSVHGANVPCAHVLVHMLVRPCLNTPALAACAALVPSNRTCHPDLLPHYTPPPSYTTIHHQYSSHCHAHDSQHWALCLSLASPWHKVACHITRLPDTVPQHILTAVPQYEARDSFGGCGVDARAR